MADKTLSAGLEAYFSIAELANQSWEVRAKSFEQTLVGMGLQEFVECICRLLWRNPHLLLDLQERVFIQGGAYWQTVPRTEEHRRLAYKPYSTSV